MKTLLVLILTAASALALDIREIHTTGGPTADLYCASGQARFGETLQLGALSAPQQAAWSAALGYAATAVLSPGEAIRSIILSPRDNGVVTATDPETEEPTAWRDLIEIAVSIDTTVEGSPAVRSQSLTSEQLPPEIRDGLLGIYTALKSLDRSQLQALGQ